MKEAYSSLQQSCQEEISTGSNASDSLRIQCRVVEPSSEERLETALEGRLLRLQAWNSAAGLSQVYNLKLAARSHCLPVFLGPRKPRFKRRVLWLMGGQAKGQRIAELGYSTVILPADRLKECKALTDYGLELFVDLSVDSCDSLCPLDGEYRAAVKEAVGALDGVAGVFWRSRWTEPAFTEHPDARDCTQYDLVLEEMELLEECLGERELIYFSVANDAQSLQSQSQWLETLCDDALKGTSIAFSTVAGEPWEDHQPLHPFWQRLRASPDHSSTPLLPIVNAGAVRQGEGLWPSLPVEMIDEVLARMKQPGFDGLIAMTASVPEAGCFLDANLWICAQACWENTSARLLEETWLRAWYPEQSYDELRNALIELRQLVVALSELQTLPKLANGSCPEADRYRVRAEGLLGRLNALRSRFLADEPSDGEGVPRFADYLCFFVRDAKRRVLHFIQSHHISMANVLTGKDMQESFWTSIGGDSSRGIGSGATVMCLDDASKGSDGSKQEQIYRLTKL